MAITISTYNHTAKLLMNKEIVLTTLKALLLNTDGIFDATHTQLTEVTDAGAHEVSGFGWDAGGEPLANEAATTVDTNDAMLDMDNLAITATGGDIGPARGLVIYDDTHADDAPLFHIDFGEELTATEGNDFNVNFSALGLLRYLVAA